MWEESRTIHLVGRSVVAFCVEAAVLVVMATSTSALAQFDCGVDQLPRETGGQNRLAVRINADWQFFPPSDDAAAHVLQTGQLQELCLAWEAPPYERNDRQIAYVSTQYRDDQPLWLFRNSAVAEVPVISRLFGDWSRTPDASGADPDNAFKEFHRGLPTDPNSAPWNNLADWHDTSAWRANHSSYDLVSSATADLTVLPYGTERLLVLAARRPLTSWVSFTSHLSSRGDLLRIAVSYSGDLDSRGPRVYRYVFEAK